MTDEEIPQEELTERQKIILSLNKANNQMLKKLERAGVVFEQIGEQRHEMFINKLVEWGIVSFDQMEEFNLEWVDFLNGFLMKAEADVRAKIAEAQAPKLFVPGHVGREGGPRRLG